VSIKINEKSRETGNKTEDEDKQSKNTTQKTKKMSNTEPTKHRGWT